MKKGFSLQFFGVSLGDYNLIARFRLGQALILFLFLDWLIDFWLHWIYVGARGFSLVSTAL